MQLVVLTNELHSCKADRDWPSKVLCLSAQCRTAVVAVYQSSISASRCGCFNPHKTARTHRVPPPPPPPAWRECLSYDTCRRTITCLVWENKVCLCRAHACRLTFSLCQLDLQSFADLLCLMGRQPCRCHLSSRQTHGVCQAKPSFAGPASKMERPEGMCVSRPSYCLSFHIAGMMAGVCSAMPLLLLAGITPRIIRSFT